MTGVMRRRVARVIRPPVDVLFVERYRSGRLRIDVTSRAARWLLRLGIVFLIGLNLSLLYASRGGWRRETLVTISPGNHPVFAPRSLLPFTLVALMVGWALVLWGAALSSTVVRATVAAAFLLLNNFLGADLLVGGGHTAGLRFGPTLVRVGYLAVPALLVTAAVAAALPRWWPRLRPVVLGGLVTASAAMFGGLMWINSALQGSGRVNVVALGLGDSIFSTRSLTVPVLWGASVEVLELGYWAVTATTMPVRRLRPAVVKALLVALITVKLVIELFSHWSRWMAFLRHRPVAAVCSVLAVAVLAVAGMLLRRPLRRHVDETDAEVTEDDEGLIYGGALTLALPLITVVLVTALGGFILNQFGSVVRILTLDFPSETIVRDGDVVIAAGLLLVGLYLLRRGRRPAVAAAVVILGGWDLLLAVPRLWVITLSPSADMVDVLLTLAVAVVAALRWRRLGRSDAAGLTALVAFSWIVSTRGAYLNWLLGSFLPAAAILTIVTGTLWAVLTDSAFASGSSRLFPDVGRPLLWVGLLVTAATMTNWVAVTHDFDLTQPIASGGFIRIGLPLAAWWVLHRRFRPGATYGGGGPDLGTGEAR